MRNSTIAPALVLAGALALGVSVAQDPPATPPVDPSAETAAQKPPPATYAITPDVIDCTTFISQDKCRTGIVIRPGPKTPDGTLTIRAVLTNPDGQSFNVPVQAECRSGCAGANVTFGAEPAVPVLVTFELPKDWQQWWHPQVASGFLGVVSSSGRFDGTPKRLRILAASPSLWQLALILVPGVIALLITLVVVILLRRVKISLTHRMGAPSWRASESWSSNLTVGAGLANGVLALAVVSDFTVFMTKPSYAVVSVLLGALVLLAPIVYGISRRAVTIEPDPAASALSSRGVPLPKPVPKEEFEGVVRVFLIAGLLTLWASGGQLLTFALLMAELWRFGALSPVVAAIIAVLVLIVFLALLKYGGVSMYEAASKAKSPVPVAKGVRARLQPRERALDWSLL